MRALASWTGVVLLVLLMSIGASGLYEDQIKKFDWRRLHIGAIDHAHLDLNSFLPRLIVSTKEQVIASLCPKTGTLLWRQVLEEGERGDIKLLHVSDGSSSTAAARANSNHGFDMLTVQGSAPALVRGWNTNTGTIEWEWSLMPLQQSRALDSFWFFSNSMIYHVLPIWQSHLEVTQYFATTGQPTGMTGKITAAWINRANCVLSGVHYACVDQNQLISIDLTAAHPQVLKFALENTPKTPIKALDGLKGIVIVDNRFVSLTKNTNACTDINSQSNTVGVFNQLRVIVNLNSNNNMLQIQANYAENCDPVPELAQNVPYPTHHGELKLLAFDCKSKNSKDAKNCVFLFGSSAESVIAVQQNKIRWIRDESLANIVATEFIDLPLADSEGTLESEVKGKAGDIVSAFARRITTQIIQIKSIFLHVVGLGPPPSDTQKAGLVRDSFGLHKMLVVLTRCGKMFGIDNISGKHHWEYFLSNIANFPNGETMRLIVQRTSKHFPLNPLCTIVARDASTGNGVLYRFNPINGKPYEGGLLHLDYKIKQLSLLAETENDFVKGILVLDGNNRANVYPAHATEMAHGIYVYTADINTSTLDGYYIKYKEGTLSSLLVWNVRLGGHAGDNKIIAVAGKNPIERVHSQGRVLGDRSVLYKYINPNLVAVITQSGDSVQKSGMTIHLVDVVSGSVIFSMMHRRVRTPLHIVHSENWLAYSYYSEKVRRTEITTIELYEGKPQTNNTVWSSLNAPPMPLIERQSYIIPAIVETMRETITERGITNKHVLIGTANGAIIEMPYALLDPRRRPISSSTQGREEGAIPYIPELPLPTENIINYNQTVARLNNIYTAPSGLESTCLVVATGLDIFVTRVAPSKTFDLLKEDFDYILISIVLVALTSGSLIVKYLSSRKLLKQAWK